MKILAENFHEFMGLCFKAKAPVKASSAPGAGKSKQTEAYARKMDKLYAAEGGYGYFELDMSKANIADLNGYLMPRDEKFTDADGNEVVVTMGRYTYPHFLIDKFTGRPAFQFKHGMVVFEEWGQGDGEVKRASAPMIYDRRLGQFHYPDFDIVILSNRPEDRSGVTKEYDFIINRWTEVELQPTLEGFLEISHMLGMTPLTQAFAARNEQDLFVNAGVPDKQGPWMTQRSLHKLDDIVQAAQREGRDFGDTTLLAACSGTVGAAMAHKYIGFAAARTKIPTISAILADPDGTPVPVEPDVLQFLVFDLASKTKRDNIRAICRYVKRLKSDLAVTYFHAATTRDDTLVSTSEFSQFAVDNLGVLTAVAARKNRMR